MLQYSVNIHWSYIESMPITKQRGLVHHATKKEKTCNWLSIYQISSLSRDQL